jgi:hypothetical protein
MKGIKTPVNSIVIQVDSSKPRRHNGRSLYMLLPSQKGTGVDKSPVMKMIEGGNDAQIPYAGVYAEVTLL